MQIVTARLRLPPIDEAHLAAMRSGEHPARWAEDFPTAGDAMIAGLYEQGGLPADERAQKFAHRLVIETESGLVVGGVGVKGLPRNGAVEIGYGIVPSRRRRGYATEAVAGLVHDLWNDPDVEFIEAQVDPANEASVRVLERNEFERFHYLGEEPTEFDRYGLTVYDYPM